MNVSIPNTYHVTVHGQDVAIATANWDEDFILQAADRAIKEFVRQHSARGPVALRDAIVALEAGSWRKLPAGPVAKAKKLIAELSLEERAMLLEELRNEHNNNKPGQ